MSTRRINQALWALSATLAVSAAVVLIVGSTLPVDWRGIAAADDAHAPAQQNLSALPPLAALETLWNMPLRGELALVAAQTAVPAAGEVTAPAGLPVTLVGTIGESLAMLKDQSGEIEIKAVGDSVAGMEVLEIRPARVQVRYNGRVLTLQKPPESGM